MSWNVVPGRLGSLLSVVVELEKGANPEDAVSAIETRVAWAAELGERRWREFPDMRTQRMSARVLELTEPAGRAQRMQTYLELLGTPDAAQADLHRIQAITAEEASRATTQLLADAGKVVVVVRPKAGAPRSGRVAP